MVVIGLLILSGFIFWITNKDSIPPTSAFPDCKRPVGPQIGKCAPNFTLPVLQGGQEGKKVSLSEYMGKPTLLYFFSTSCSPCISQLPEMMEIQSFYGDQVNFLYVNLFQEEMDIQSVKDFLDKIHKKTGQSLSSLSPILLGDKEMTLGLYQVIAKPIMFFMNAKGLITHIRRWDGDSKEDWKKGIEENLKKLIHNTRTS